MEIAETSIFAKEITTVLGDTGYRDLQLFLVEHPKNGKLIKGSE